MSKAFRFVSLWTSIKAQWRTLGIIERRCAMLENAQKSSLSQVREHISVSAGNNAGVAQRSFSLESDAHQVLSPVLSWSSSISALASRTSPDVQAHPGE